ncbi:MarR family winged helix-turn-helix transcriptional regulator [Fibrella forsythiae]|uniref:MarR family transcriptional regulator n=1 Tax=Fibrella forsythiae TaxID=2817061 RepID=A0ABS3JDC3_9BACT|nr:MarR family transcriptional regulator [Fibrella forsythiae]MBO0947988.1 MarR family transcriptional regulator [Fibrella forsythiae]
MIDEETLRAKFAERMGSQAIFMISHVGHLMAKKANRELTRLGFTIQIEQFPVLFVTYFAGDELLSQQDIANMLQKDKSGIQRSIRTLERDGFLRVVSDSVDRRKNLIKLTPAGKMIIEKAIQTTEMLDQQVMSQLSQEERDAFLTTTRKIIALIDN